MPRNPAHSDVEFWRDPALPGVELRFSRYHEHAFRDHVHTAYSIALVETGRTLFVLNGQAHDASSGQIVMIGPSEVHACNPDPGSEMSYRMYYLDRGWLESPSASEGAEPRFPAVIDDPELFDELRGLFFAIIDGCPSGQCRQRLESCLARLTERHALKTRGLDSEPDERAVAIAREVLMARFAERISIDELASAAGVSRAHLSRIFRVAEGLSPHVYQNQLRVEFAKRKLAEGCSVAEVANAAGFSDQSHFSRTFRQFTGATPLQYRDLPRES